MTAKLTGNRNSSKISKNYEQKKSNFLQVVITTFLLGSLIATVYLDSHFASASTTGGTISGFIFQDSNLNAKKDKTEVGLQGWNATLTGRLDNGTIYGPVTIFTNSTGGYSYANLAGGTYNLTENIATSWGPTTNPAVSNIQITSDSTNGNSTNGNSTNGSNTSVDNGYTGVFDSNTQPNAFTPFGSLFTSLAVGTKFGIVTIDVGANCGGDSLKAALYDSGGNLLSASNSVLCTTGKMNVTLSGAVTVPADGKLWATVMSSGGNAQFNSKNTGVNTSYLGAGQGSLSFPSTISFAADYTYSPHVILYSPTALPPRTTIDNGYTGAANDNTQPNPFTPMGSLFTGLPLGTIDKMTIDVGANCGGDSLKVALYDSGGNLLFASNSVLCTTGKMNVTLSSAVTVPVDGKLWAMVMSSGGNAQFNAKNTGTNTSYLGAGRGGLSFPSAIPGLAADYTYSPHVILYLQNNLAPTEPPKNPSSNIVVNFGVQVLLPVITASDYYGIVPEEIVFDSSGNLYDPETIDGDIKKFDANGTLKAIIGAKGTGNGMFYRPTGIVVDSNGNLWAADVDASISKFDKNGNFLFKFRNTGKNDINEFSWPRGLAVDKQNNLYVADGNNNRVLKFDQNGKYLMSIGKDGGWYNGYFLIPYDVALDSHENIYVVDTGNNRIQKFDPNGNFLASYGGYGTGFGSFNRPRAIFFGTDDTVYVADAYNSRIQVFDSNFNFIRAFGSLGSGPGQFANPSGVVVDNNGTIYVADLSNARIEKFNSTGNFQSQFLTRSSVMQPYFETLDNSGHLLVTDGINHMVITFDVQSGSFLSTFGDIGTGPGQFHGPRGVKIDSDGNIIVADNYNNRVQKFDHNGKFLLMFGGAGKGPGQFNEVRGVAIDATGNIWVADSVNNRLQEFDSNGHYLSSLKVGDPYGINIDSEGRIYVAEFYSNYVEKFASNGTLLLKIGGTGIGNGQFGSPRDVFIDKNGNMYVTDKGNARVQKFDKNGNFLMKFGSFGSGNKQFNNLRGIVVDPSGNIFVADSGNGRISKYNSNGVLLKNIPFSISEVNVTGITSIPSNNNGWHNKPVTITWDGSEIGTGIQFCDSPVSYSGPETKSVIITGHCIDKEGVNGIGAVQIRYDTTPPTLNLPSHVVVNSTNPSGANVTYYVSSSDILSNSTIPVCNPPSGSNFTVGDTNVTCSATDLASNIASGQFVVTVNPSGDDTVMNDTTASFGIATNSSRPINAEYVTSKSVLIGKSIDTIVVDLKKVGAPSGTAQVGVFNNDQSIKQLFGTINASSISPTPTQYSFSLSPPQAYQIQSGDRIGIKFTGGNSSSYISIMFDSNGSFDGTNSYRTIFNSGWKSITGQDLFMILKIHH